MSHSLLIVDPETVRSLTDIFESNPTSRPLRVLQFISTLQMGGAAKGVVELVRALEARQDVEVKLCAVGNTHSLVDTSQLRHPPIDLGCSVHSRWLARRRRASIRSQIRAYRPDIVHSHLWPTAREVAWAIGRSRLPHLVHIRDTPPSFVDHRWQSRLKTRWLRYSLSSPQTQFVAVSDAARDYAIQHLGLDSERISVIINGIDLQPLLEVAHARTCRSDTETVIGTVTRLVPAKGVGDLIEACRRLIEGGRNIRLRIAGDGSQRASLEASCAQAGIESRVEFAGQIDNLPEFLASLDLFAFTSFAEGLPRVLLEAMASGLPVVTTDCQGVENISGLAQCGIIVPRGDSSALAAAIDKLASRPDELSRRGKLAITAAERDHSIDRVCREVVGMYRRLVHQKGANQGQENPRC